MAKQEPHAVFARKIDSPVFNPMLGASPSELQRILNEGIAHHKAGNKEEAERHYRRVLELAPNQPDALNLLGVLAAESEYFDIAIDMMKQAVAVRPKDPGILNNLGHCFYEAGRHQEARDPLERAVALRPDFDEAKYNLGQVLRQLGETELALKLWREVWAADNRVFAALVGICGILADQGHFEEAEQTAARKLRHRTPGAALYHLTDHPARPPHQAHHQNDAARFRIP